MKGSEYRMKNKNLFSVVVKAIGFAWRTNRKLLLILILLNVFQGAVVYQQFASFSAIVDAIIAIKSGVDATAELIRSSIILGLSFLFPSIAGNVLAYCRARFRQEQHLQLDLFRIEQQSSLDIGTLESSSYQNLLRGAQEWGTSSILSLQDFVFTSSTSFAGIVTSMIILWSLNEWLVVFAVLAAAPIYFFYKKYSMEVFRVRWFSVEDHRVISDRTSHFEDLHKTIDVILLKLKSWFKGQIQDD